MAASSRETSTWVDEYADNLRVQPHMQSTSLRQFAQGPAPMSIPETYSRYELQAGQGQGQASQTGPHEYTSDPLQMITVPLFVDFPNAPKFTRRMESTHIESTMNSLQQQGPVVSGQPLRLPEYHNTRNSSVVSDQGPNFQTNYTSSSASMPYGHGSMMFNPLNYTSPLTTRSPFPDAALTTERKPTRMFGTGMPGANVEIGNGQVDTQDRFGATPREFPQQAVTESVSGSVSTTKKRPRKRLNALQRQAHNTIEKRYRIKINAKIAELNEMVPMFIPGGHLSEKEGHLQQGAHATRLNKSVTLERSTEYIAYLKKENARLETLVSNLQLQLQSQQPSRN